MASSRQPGAASPSDVDAQVAAVTIQNTAAGSVPDADRDLEARGGVHGVASTKPTLAPTDIEHFPVDDDPRSWSAARKWSIVAIISWGAFVPAAGGNIFFPSIADLKSDLGATEQDISLSVSLYILAQGLFPLLWSPISELIGRKPCFVSAMAFYTILSGCTALAKNMATVIALRALAAAGSSVALAIAAGTLSDLYIAEERGAKVGIYYAIPISGPAIAPIIGGLLTEAAGWRAVFWFLAAAGASSTLAYLCMKETFRTERSAAWQNARKAALAKADKRQDSENQHTAEVLSSSEDAGSTGSSAPMAAPDYHGPGLDYMSSAHGDAGKGATPGVRLPDDETTRPTRPPVRRGSLTRVVSHRSIQAAGRVKTRDGQEVKFKPSLSDVSPLGSAGYVLSKPHNLSALTYSGIAFAAQYSLSFTATTTFTAPPYSYTPVLIGCVLLSLGVGGMIGSIVGGRISDLRLRKILRTTGKKAEPEERLRTILIPMIVVVPAFVGYGWATQYETNIAVPIVILVILGYAQIHCYSVDLSYLVDSNPGRSSGAVAVNSAFRGVCAFVASEVASPLLNGVGNGPLQTGWAVIIAFTVVWLFISSQRGEQWRNAEWKWPRPWRRTDWRADRPGGARWVKERQLSQNAAQEAAEKT